MNGRHVVSYKDEENELWVYEEKESVVDGDGDGDGDGVDVGVIVSRNSMRERGKKWVSEVRRNFLGVEGVKTLGVMESVVEGGEEELGIVR